MIKTVYYKIPHEWAVKAGLADVTPQHPDGMHLVLPLDGFKISSILARETGNPPLLAAEAILAIGGIEMTPEQAMASARGEFPKPEVQAPSSERQQEQPTEAETETQTESEPETEEQGEPEQKAEPQPSPEPEQQGSEPEQEQPSKSE